MKNKILSFLFVKLIFSLTAFAQNGEVGPPFIYGINSGPNMMQMLDKNNPMGFFLNALKVFPESDIEIYVVKPKNADRSQESYKLGGTTREKFLWLLQEGDHLQQNDKGFNTFLRVLRFLKAFPDRAELHSRARAWLEEGIGPVKTAYVFANLKTLDEMQLLKVIGLKSPGNLLVMRRFGFVRDRMFVRGDEGTGEEGKVHIIEMDTVLADSAHPFIPGQVPPPFYLEFESGVGMGDNMTSKELRLMWGEYSSKFHELSIGNLRHDMENGTRRAVTPHLLETLQQENQHLDLTRAFFFIVEDYETEKMLATMAIINGSQRRGRSNYDLPVFRRLKEISPDYNPAAKFSGEVYEIHSLAKDRNNPQAVPLEAFTLALGQHIDEAKLHDAWFVAQTDRAGARMYKKFGLIRDKEATEIIGENEVVLYVKGRDLIKNIRALSPPPTVTWSQLANHPTKRVAGPYSDATCVARLRAAATAFHEE